MLKSIEWCDVKGRIWCVNTHVKGEITKVCGYKESHTSEVIEGRATNIYVESKIYGLKL